MTTQYQNSLLIVCLLPCAVFPFAAPAQNSIGNIYNNQGIITQGQQGNNTIIRAPVDREIPDIAAASMVEVLRSAGSHTASVGYDGIGSDAEQVRFSEKIRKLFIDAGWNPPPVAGRIDMSRPPLIGVHFFVKDPQNPPRYLKGLYDIFDAAGLIDHSQSPVGVAAYLPDTESITVLSGHDPKN